MIEDLASMEPAKRPDDATEKARQEQFKQANASLALAGMHVTPGDLDIQARIARGELTPDEAVALYLQHAKRAGA